MVGDLVALMLDESLGISTDYAIIEHDIHSYTAGYVLDPRRTKLKKYWKYTDRWKEEYINQFADDAVIVSHDTDFSKTLDNTTIQIVCDAVNVVYFARRFQQLHRDAVVDTVRQSMNTVTDAGFVLDYANDITEWQTYHQFLSRFNVDNVRQLCFVDELRKFMRGLNACVDVGWATHVHTRWLERNA